MFDFLTGRRAGGTKYGDVCIGACPPEKGAAPEPAGRSESV